ncbi:MAG: hypothetical protein QNJ38_01300 [Prochloraceae cyanobacterium]|nr:hypothetical protein [Prochloraceae cyanobacterium]
MKIVHPLHYQIIEREGTTWFFKEAGNILYNHYDRPVELSNIEEKFNLTKSKIVIELFRINGGRSGFYLVNMRDRKYYYCGKDWDSVKEKFLDLGIGRRDPIG